MKEFEWETYRRYAIPPLMSREQWEAHWERLHSGDLPTNPYEW
jgi:hypothetical protein